MAVKMNGTTVPGGPLHNNAEVKGWIEEEKERIPQSHTRKHSGEI